MQQHEQIPIQTLAAITALQKYKSPKSIPVQVTNAFLKHKLNECLNIFIVYKAN